MSSQLQTRLRDHLHTNYIPSSEEREEIQALIHDPEEEIRGIDFQISSLLARRDKLHQDVHPLRMLISPCRRVPCELWSVIFIWCLPVETLPTHTVKQAPLLLTLVCHSWRETALKTPGIWNALHISIPGPNRTLGPGILEKSLTALKEGVMLWFVRSGSLPLKLSLDTNDTWSVVSLYQDSISQPDFKDPYFDLMHAITTQACRWKHLWLFLLPPPIFQPFHKLVAEDLPLLETVVESTSLLNVADPSRSLDHNSPILSVLQQSPALQTLLMELGRESDIEYIPLRWSQLTTLQIEFTHPTSGFDALQRLSQLCPSLFECTLIIYIDLVEPIPDVTPYREWTYLRKLNLLFAGCSEGAYDSEIRRTFAAVTTPALIHLSVGISYTHHVGEHDPDCIAAMENNVPFHILLERSHCELLSLDIHILLPPTFSKTLRLLPKLHILTIRCLTLRSMPSGEDMDSNKQFSNAIQALIPSQGCVICSNLEQIRFMGFLPHHTMSLLALVDARIRHTDLKSLSAVFGMLSQADIEVLESAQQQARAREFGVRIEWEFERKPGELSCFQTRQAPSHSEVLIA
ncbi:hypothetical protein V5O48_004061 [Marasmius crinis-equi]|uniref:F-box domain-containing protein n=1 Tax=Marasmius crinis-equi TaxID=585013 RepID=A0ABR3FR80_9AGAR